MKSSGKTVIGVVSNSNSVIDGLELGDSSDGPENLFLHNLHVFLNTREEGWLDEIALGSMALSTGFNCGTFLLAVVDICHDPVELELRHLGSLESIWMEGIANHVLCDPLLERRDELFEIVNANSDQFVIKKPT